MTMTTKHSPRTSEFRDWKYVAVQWLCAARTPKPALLSEIAFHAQDWGHVRTPPDRRWWGSAILEAQDMGHAERTGSKRDPARRNGMSALWKLN